MTRTGDTATILVDWGNTNLRFYRKLPGKDRERRTMPEGGIQQLKLFRRTDRPLHEPLC